MSGERRVCPPDHKHGENLTCYTSHACRCDDCLNAHAEHQFWRRHMIVAGRTDVFDRLVPSAGVQRRVQALMRIGYSQSRLALMLGTSQTTVSAWMVRDQVRTSTHEAVAALYERLQDRPATATTKPERMSVHRTLALAARRGYARPIDWDDIDADDAPHFPDHESAKRDQFDVDDVAVQLAVDGVRVDLTVAERREVVRILNQAGHDDHMIAEHARCSVRQVLRIRGALGLPAAVGPDGERVAS